MKFFKCDTNYFNKGSASKDCVIRALSFATHYGYRYICNELGKGDYFRLGIGYNGHTGITQDELDRFADKTGIIEHIWGDDALSDMLTVTGTDDGDTLELFLDTIVDEILEYNDLKKDNLRLFFKVRTPNTRGSDDHHFHATTVCWDKELNDWACVDIETIKNIEYSIPIHMYVVRKMAEKDSPNFWLNEKRTMLARYREAMSRNADILKK